MGKIIVGVDGSDTASNAAARAAVLASALGHELIVVSAFSSTDPLQMGRPGDELDLSASDVALKMAEQAIEDLPADLAGLPTTPRSEFGKPADVLVSVAEELGASIIVVGNKRVQGVTRVLGSIAADVARHAPCDILIAHTH
ncbi:universal stress protein [Pseudofrankia asymbiotica]|uniref:Universal stress protein UspA n=1 Tax=Pseudofrankia asymbiotica TaxID=1834516 RepID=A0A1V2I176_9ACTN|nr:universal stress protein [Pseudofrankia asymbiotica]ONH23306.1 universal stress protein UspA [Pseudofrankia asymbiotica]